MKIGTSALKHFDFGVGGQIQITGFRHGLRIFQGESKTSQCVPASVSFHTVDLSQEEMIPSNSCCCVNAKYYLLPPFYYDVGHQ